MNSRSNGELESADSESFDMETKENKTNITTLSAGVAATTLNEPVQRHRKNVSKRLQVFIQYFVKGFETKLQAYRLVLEMGVEKPGKIADGYSEPLGQGIGAAAAVSIVALFGFPLAVVSALPSVVGTLSKKISSSFGSNIHYKKCAAIAKLVFDEDKASLREKLVRAGYDLFQSYEHQFMEVYENGVYNIPLKRLADDAVNRAINHITTEKETTITVSSITKAVILGESKDGKWLSLPIPSSHLKTPGFETRHVRTSGKDKKWYTSSLYEKVGLVKEEDVGEGKMCIYYQKKGCKTQKYGFRRLLKAESWEKLQADYEEFDIAEYSQYKNYEYILSSENSDKESQRILDKINLYDTAQDADRIKDAMKEMKDELLLLIAVSNEQKTRSSEVMDVLMSVKKNLDDLNVELYFQEVAKIMWIGFRDLSGCIEKSTDEIKEQNERHHVEIKHLFMKQERMLRNVALKFEQNEDPDPPTKGLLNLPEHRLY